MIATKTLGLTVVVDPSTRQNISKIIVIIAIHYRKLNHHHLIIQPQPPTPQRYMSLPRRFTGRQF